MFNNQHISVVIPALNEALAIGKVVGGLRALCNGNGTALIDDIVVCDNGSTDDTVRVAEQHGARVVMQRKKGYGIACLTAIRHLRQTDIVLFVDGDDSCVLTQAIRLIAPVGAAEADIVIGSRTLGQVEAGALTPPQAFGNWVATTLIRWIWCCEMTDLGPFRAIRFEALKSLCMQDEQFGWTVEMQIKALQKDLLMIEVPVDSTCRIGESKISGTLSGVIGAGKGILGKILALWWSGRRSKKSASATAGSVSRLAGCNGSLKVR
ncbi:MAG: glycosyltransferase family 2 protein [Pseudomonadales bacterium]|nr:glycosyltransferase family 2 protein [Pseudomonadales bacterium]